jgi:drug/metabolite transporter (DMT)-like permease
VCWTEHADGVTRRQADLTLLLATFLWGTTFAVVKDALSSATPLAFLTLRFSIAALLLAPGTRFRPLPAGRELRGGLLLGALVAVGFITQTAGLVITTASRSAFIVAISSVLAPVIALALLGQRPGWLTAAALGMATVGIYLLTAPDAGGLNRGDLLTLVCAACFGAQIVAVTELGREYDARRLVWFQVAGTAIVSACALLLLERPRIHWSGAFLAALAYSVVFASTTCFLLQMSAQRHMSSARAALIFCFEPLFAALTSWLVLGERLAMLQWLGGGLIVLGMIAADLPASRAAAAGP